MCRGDPNVSSGSEFWPTRRDVLKKFYNYCHVSISSSVNCVSESPKVCGENRLHYYMQNIMGTVGPGPITFWLSLLLKSVFDSAHTHFSVPVLTVFQAAMSPLIS